METRLLFVCHANINRNPAAECITRTKTAGSGLKVTSAGLISPPFTTISDEMNLALIKLGYPDFNRHKSRRITRELLTEQDLILCFEKSQVPELVSLVDNKSIGIHTLPEFAGFPSKDVSDPHDFINDNVLSRLAATIPFPLSWVMYKLLGYVHPSDKSAVYDIHVKVAKKIEFYVDKTIARMKRESLINLYL